MLLFEGGCWFAEKVFANRGLYVKARYIAIIFVMIYPNIRHRCHIIVVHYIPKYSYILRAIIELYEKYRSLIYNGD